eukprot:TRINITY_DN20665_c0_g1_i2.p1 TRINITY_DN20665_c0_g1~~TRINITY_DN20665_c0_g1_i2.p1  ORF type:complete len:124 (-),score=44.09 TRINITY_DN20665_c0_g1_i2:139-510(-)
MLRSLVGSEMCIRDRVSTQSTGGVMRTDMEGWEVDKVFDLIDVNGDGFLDKAELVSGAGGDDFAVECLEECDLNDDGLVSREEWRKVLCGLEEEDYTSAMTAFKTHFLPVSYTHLTLPTKRIV